MAASVAPHDGGTSVGDCSLFRRRPAGPHTHAHRQQQFTVHGFLGRLTGGRLQSRNLPHGQVEVGVSTETVQHAAAGTRRARRDAAHWVHFLGLVVEILFLPGPGVLEPDLSDPFAQARDLSDALEVLSVRVRVQVEVGLQHLELLLGEGGAHALRFRLGSRATRAGRTAFLLAVLIVGTRSPVQELEVVRLAEHPSVVEREFLARGQLSLAGIAGEAGQVVDLLSSSAHPIRGTDGPAALGALGRELTNIVGPAVDASMSYEAGRLVVQ